MTKKIIYAVLPILMVVSALFDGNSFGQSRVRRTSDTPKNTISNMRRGNPLVDADRAGLQERHSKTEGAIENQNNLGAEQPLTFTTAVDISGSVINSKQGQDAYRALRQATPDALRPGDQFSLDLFYSDQLLVTVSRTPWGEEAERAFDTLLKLRLRPGDRSRFSPLLSDIARRARAGDVVTLVTDGVVSSGTAEGDKEDREQSLAAAGEIVARGVKVVIVPVHSPGTPSDSVEWLARALQAQVIPVEDLRAGALAKFIGPLRRPPDAVGAKARQDTNSTPQGSPSLFAHVLVLGAIVLLAAAVLVRRVRGPIQKTATTPSEKPPLNIKVSWADANDQEFQSRTLEVDDGFSIGGAEADTLRRDGLRPGHVKLHFDDTETRLEANGPVRLDGEITLAPDDLSPAIETFPARQAVAFTVDQTTFVVEPFPEGRRQGAR